jgi:hypothetical protein
MGSGGTLFKSCSPHVALPRGQHQNTVELQRETVDRIMGKFDTALGGKERVRVYSKGKILKGESLF